MLTACIVYVQGSAGNLVARSLALDPTTVAYGQSNNAVDRAVEYANWNSANWTQSEKQLEIDYLRGDAEFVSHEQSEQKLVHRLHPAQFVDGSKILWTGEYTWQNLIFIVPDDIETITKLAQRKRIDLDHQSQITKETQIWNNLVEQATYKVNFTELLDDQKFYMHIDNLCAIINVNYYPELVKKIWTKWYTETCKLI